MQETEEQNQIEKNGRNQGDKMMKTKKALKTILIISCIVVFIFATIYIVTGFTVTMDTLMKYLPFSNGYISQTIHREKEDIEKTYGIEIDENIRVQLVQTFEWEGRDVWAYYIDSSGEKEKIKGKMVWHNTFEWGYE